MSPFAALRAEAGGVLRFSGAPWRPVAATQAAIAMGIAILIPTLLGRSDLGLLASIGALSGLYLGGRSLHERARRLPLIQVGLLVAIALGAAVAGQPIVGPIVLAAVTIAAAVLILGFRIGPPAVLFFVLAPGAGDLLVSPISQGGHGLSAMVLLGMAAVGAAIAYLTVVAPLVVPRVRRRDRLRGVDPLRFALSAEVRVILLRIAVAVVLATAVSSMLGLHRAYWAQLAVIATLQSSAATRMTVVRGVHRVVGTVLGVLVFLPLAALHLQGLAVVVLVAVLQFATEFTIARHYGLALLFLTPLAMTIGGVGTGSDLLTDVGDRVIDTAIGGGIALLVLAIELAGARALAAARDAR